MRMVAVEAAEASAAVEVAAPALFSMAAEVVDSARLRLSEAAEVAVVSEPLRLSAVAAFAPRASMAAVADTGVDIAITIAAVAIMAARPITMTDHLIITRAGAASSGPITGRAVSAMSDIGITTIIVPITGTIITTATATISDSGLAGEAG